MTKLEEEKLINWAKSYNKYFAEKKQSLIPIEVYKQVLEYVRIGVPSLANTIDGVKVRKRTKRCCIGTPSYNEKLCIVPITRDKEAYFKRV